jgi:FMN-dependent NADH-azoreductase
MTNILLILSSPRDGSLSSRLAVDLAASLKAKKDAKIKVRDLAATPLPHISDAYISGRLLTAEQRTTDQVEAVAFAETLVAELAAADIVIIGSGMINFGLSTQLKAWFDYVTWPGVTFSYGPEGVAGKVTGKKVYVVTASGGVFSTGPAAAVDFQTPYLRHLLGFIGLTDVEQIQMEGVAFGADAARDAVAKASEAISAVAEAA